MGTMLCWGSGRSTLWDTTTWRFMSCKICAEGHQLGVSLYCTSRKQDKALVLGGRPRKLPNPGGLTISTSSQKLRLVAGRAMGVCILTMYVFQGLPLH